MDKSAMKKSNIKMFKPFVGIESEQASVGQLTITASNVNCILSYGQHCVTWIIYLFRFL